MELHNKTSKRPEDRDFDIWRLQRMWDNKLVDQYQKVGEKVWFSRMQGPYVNPERNERLNKKQRRMAKRQRTDGDNA